MKLFDNSNTNLKIRIHNLNVTGSDQLLDVFLAEMKTMQDIMPIVSALGNHDLRERHWKQIFELISQTFNPGKVFSLKDLIEEGICDKQD